MLGRTASKFEGRFYIQEFDIGMGSPFNLVLTVLYTIYFEFGLMSFLSPTPSLWLRGFCLARYEVTGKGTVEGDGRGR